MKNNSNKPAFSYVVPKGIGAEHSPVESGVSPGLTKREYFAAKAMQGILASTQPVELAAKVVPNFYSDRIRMITSASIGIADDLLSQLES